MIGGGLLLVGHRAAARCATSTPTPTGRRCCPGFLVAGVGVGLINPPLASTAVGVVPPQRAGMASGINITFRQVGIATGIAGLGALFQQLLDEQGDRRARARARRGARDRHPRASRGRRRRRSTPT